MKRSRGSGNRAGIAAGIAGVCLLLVTVPYAEETAAVEAGERQPAVAGQFYPNDPVKLEAAIKAYMKDARPARTARPVAIVAPHAGYIYSGQIAADAYHQAVGHDYDLIVILGTNHTTGGFGGVSVYPDSGYRTPLGLAEIDTEVAAKLTAADTALTFRPAVHDREHSVEVQVPFVQVLFPKAKIVPMVIGHPDLELCERLGGALAKVLEGRRALIVASSDFSHYPEYDDAVETDRAVLEAVAALDPAHLDKTIRAQMRRGVRGLSTCACGEGPILAAQFAARALGATRGVVVSYANSGDTAVGDRSRVVGYGAVVFTTGEGGPDTGALKRSAVEPGTAPLDPAAHETLLAFARATIDRFIASGTAPLARDLPSSVCRKQGAFVTLKKEGRLRGCIGHRADDTPLCQVVGAMALQAAFNDRRFSPLEPGELADVEIEISALTPLARVTGPDDVVVGRDGVMLVKDEHGAIFLPQVAVERGWERDEMLDRLCRKAGLPEGSWREGADLYTFQAEVFNESGGG
jgi:AmmeMemoRadiSam system protein B/AmmeMemoRadiSam system protein A